MLRVGLRGFHRGTVDQCQLHRLFQGQGVGESTFEGKRNRYRYQQLAHFERYSDWERYWESPEMVDFRASHSSWYQIPVLYGWWDLAAAGKISAETEWVLPEPPEPDPDGNGGNGLPARPGSGAPRVQHV